MVFPHTLRHVTLLIVSSAVFLVTPGASSRAADEPKVDLATIQQSWSEWRKSFATIRIVGREWDQDSVFQYYKDVDQSTDEWRRTYYVKNEFAWADIGACKHDTIVHKAGKAVARYSMGADGARPWSGSTAEGGDINKWDGVLIYRPMTDRPLSSNLTIPYIWGLWNSVGFWFDEFIMRGDSPTIVGTEDVGGVMCVVVKKPFDNQREFTYWLDPTHSYLPNKCMERGPKGPKGVGEYHTWKITEYQQLDNRFWFPKRTTFVIPDRPLPGFECEIDEVVLNESLPRSYFGPPQPSPGTRITDYQAGAAHRAPGGPEPAPAEPRTTPVGGGNIRANAPSVSWKRWGMFGAAVVAIGVVVRWWQQSHAS